jgi:hypothetical protein
MWQLALTAWFLAASPARAVDLRLLDDFSCTFPATTTVWRVQASASAPVTVSWELTLYSAVVDRGQVLADPARAGQPIGITARIPPLREGVTGQATLIIQATAEGQSARLVHPVWILPADPWSGLRTELTKNPLRVHETGPTLSARLSDAGLKTTAMRNAAAIAALTNGLLLVAEGISLRAQRGLADALVRAAAGGARVILLAPSDGPLPLPCHETLSGLPRPVLRLGGVEALLQLDKRLDAYVWPGHSSVIASSFLLSAERRQPEATWSPGTEGWVWLDMDFRGSGGGRLLAVGWAPAQAWESGPAPRHTLAALMRHVLE